MSKKSYKRNQNRLYREIKRRMLLEQMVYNPPVTKRKVEYRNVETLKIRNLIPCHEFQEGCDEYVKQKMVHDIAQKLYEDHYIVFLSKNDEYYGPLQDYIEIEARLNVLRPRV